MKNFLLLIIFLYFTGFCSVSAQTFTMEQVTKFPFPSGLTASPVGEKIAWAMNEQGKRNVYLAEGPDFSPEKITAFNEDDGQEISSLQFSPDGKFLIFVRGGDHGGGNASRPVNPQHRPEIPKVEIWKITLETKEVKVIGEGDHPTLGHPNKLACLKNGQVWSYDLAEDNEPEQLFDSRGNMHSLEFAPNGEKLLFVSARDGHSLIGVFEPGENIQWISPGFFRDRSPRWSPDGNKVVFVRTPGGTGAALPLLEQRHSPWEVHIAEIETGKSDLLWKAPETLAGSVPTVDGGFNLHWAADDDIIFLSYEEGWPNLYKISADGGDPVFLTPGENHIEHVKLSPDKKFLAFSANSGSKKEDLDRRHIGLVDISEAGVEWKTEGEGIEAYPVFVADHKSLAYLSATAKRPLLPVIKQDGKVKILAEELIPDDFPQGELVVPKQVSFPAPDGTLIYGQVFEKEGGENKKPGVVFIHGGPQRQMLLGWSYMDYYSNTYAVNQYLANRGFVVLSVNYRLGIGYGYDFHKPVHTYFKGAAEYKDVKAAGEYLAGLPGVDSESIGVYGGSYGGYLTALALGKDPGLFKVGVDIHGVHDFEGRYELPEGYEKAPDYEEALEIAWESSPQAYLDTWEAPVLFIHGDDDRNVPVKHTTNFIRRFEEKKIPYEYLMIPDETHHWMKFSNLVKVNKATAEFLERYLMKNP